MEKCKVCRRWQRRRLAVGIYDDDDWRRTFTGDRIHLFAYAGLPPRSACGQRLILTSEELDAALTAGQVEVVEP